MTAGQRASKPKGFAAKVRNERTSKAVASDAARLVSVERQYDAVIIYIGREEFTIRQLKAIGASCLTQAADKPRKGKP